MKASLRAWIGGSVVALLLSAEPAAAKEWQEDDFGKLPPATFSFQPPGPGVPEADVETVVGAVETYQPTKGDTFYDLARHFGLGHNEIIGANRGTDEWIPDRTGKPLTIPKQWVLPDAAYEGLVINIPEMRLYYYPKRGAGGRPTVITFAVGLGREDWRTPEGKFTVREKTVNPTWVIPESIRKERIADKGWSETAIPGGAPENPLGKFRMRLSLDLYGIHGTNIPWGVGMMVSHGCVRLYNEDIERLYPMVPQGTAGEFVYQTVKVGLLNDRVYVEVHDDLYGIRPGPWRQAIAMLERKGLRDRVDEDALLRAVQESTGIPVDVTRSGFAPETELAPEQGLPGERELDRDPWEKPAAAPLEQDARPLGTLRPVSSAAR